MKKLLPMLLFFLVPAVSFGQGSAVNDVAFKNLITGIAPAAGATVTVCTSAGTGIPCTPLATVYSDIALTVPKTNPLTADSNGYYSFFAAAGTYIVTISGAGTSGRSVTYTLPFTLSGNNAFSGNNTHSGTETFTGSTSISKLNNIFFVDGTTYALTDVGVNAAIAAATAQGGGEVWITKPITSTANINMASNVHIRCTDWESAPITWAGGVGPNAIFVGGAITNASVRNCNLKGPNMAATPIPVLTTSTAGGSLGAGITVFVKTTYVNGNGETLASTEASIVTGAGATNSVTVQAPWTGGGVPLPPIPATGYTVYSSTTTNTEKQQAVSGNCVNITTNCVIQVIGAGANAPATTSAAVNIDLRGIEIDGLDRSFVEYNKITGMSYCIFETSGGQEMQINHNFVQSCTLQGIVTFDNDVIVSKNHIDTIGTSNLHHGIYNSGGTGIMDEGNQISNVMGFCIQVFASSSPQVNNEVQIIGNGCEVGGQAPSGPRGGYLSQYNSPGGAPNKIIMADNIAETLGGDRCLGLGDVTDASVHDNICKNFGPGEGFYITPTQGTGIQNLDVHDNIFNGNTSTGNGINCNQGTGGVSNFTIHHNILLNIRAIGIEVLGCNDGTISGNVIKNFNLGASFSSGITIDTPTTGVTVSGNRIRTTAANGNCLLVVAGATDNVVYGNIDLNCAAALSDSGTRTIVYGEKLNSADNYFRLSGLGSQLVLPGATSGTVNLAVPAVAGANTATFPAVIGTVDETTNTTTTTSFLLHGSATAGLGTWSAFAPATDCATCTTNAAALTSNAVVLGGGGQAAKTATAFTTNGTTTMTVGVAAGGNGVLALAGNTSGTATFTAPATAGTVTNPVVASNTLQLPGLVASGTAAALTGTGACATFSTQTGGAWAGRATCTAATAASTFIITPGATAPNGWVCYAQDQTTRANLLQQTSTTTTACTLTATSVTQNDVIVFTAFAF